PTRAGDAIPARPGGGRRCGDGCRCQVPWRSRRQRVGAIRRSRLPPLRLSLCCPTMTDIETTTGVADALQTVRLLPKHHRRVRAGHPWVYSNEIDMTAELKRLAPGALVRVADAGDGAVGVAMFNPHSLVAARMLSAEPALP